MESQTGNNNKSIALSVQPLPQDEIKVYGLHLGQTATIDVHINANPAPRVEWEVDNKKLPQGYSDERYNAYEPVDLGNGMYSVKLTIAPLTAEDTTKVYKLKAANLAGRTDYTVRVSSSPHSESGIDIGSVLGIIIGIAILLIIVGIVVFARATGRWCFSGKFKAHVVSSIHFCFVLFFV